MIKILLFLLPCIMLLGCTTPYDIIKKAYKEGKITREQALQLAVGVAQSQSQVQIPYPTTTKTKGMITAPNGFYTYKEESTTY